MYIEYLDTAFLHLCVMYLAAENINFELNNDTLLAWLSRYSLSRILLPLICIFKRYFTLTVEYSIV